MVGNLYQIENIFRKTKYHSTPYITSESRIRGNYTIVTIFLKKAQNNECKSCEMIVKSKLPTEKNVHTIFRPLNNL